MLWLEIEKPIEEPWARLIERKLPLTAIQSFDFERSRHKDLTLQFSFGRMSKGTLILYSEKDDKSNHSEKNEFKIELLGYPSPLGVKGKMPDGEKKLERSELLYPVEVYKKLYEDPNEKKAEQKS